MVKLPDHLPKHVARNIIFIAYLIGLCTVQLMPKEHQPTITNFLILIAIFLYATNQNENQKPKETENEPPVCKYRRTEDYTKGERRPNRRDGDYDARWDPNYIQSSDKNT